MGWPTTQEPRDNFLTLRLTDAEQAEVDAYVQRRGENRSAAVRNLLLGAVRKEMRAGKKGGKS